MIRTLLYSLLCFFISVILSCRGGDLDPLGLVPSVIQNIEARQELLDRIEQELEEIRQERNKARRELEEKKKLLGEAPKSKNQMPPGKRLEK